MSPRRCPGRPPTLADRAPFVRLRTLAVLGACAGLSHLGVASAESAPAGGGAALRASAPSLRTDGRTTRFVDRRVSRASRVLSGELLGVSDGRRSTVVQTASGRQVPVRFGGRPLPRRAVGAGVRVRVDASGAVRTATFTTPLRTIATAAPTAHRAYVALVSNKASFGAADDTIADVVDAALGRWQEVSNGAISSFVRQETRQLATTTDCTSGSAMYNEARDKLFPGLNTGSTSGNHVIVISPPGCAGGVGTVQAGIASGGRLHAGWNPRSTIQTLMHELGHNFSLAHANACYAPVGPDCVTQEYANTYALMGFTIGNTPAFTPAALDSFERTRLGITDAGEVAAVTLAPGQRATTGTYDLRARGTSSGLRGLRITDPTTGTVHSVDWRSGGGRDALSSYALDPGKDNPGVTVQRLDDDGESAAVLGHRNPDPSKAPQFGLTAGRTFTAAGTTITVLSTGDENDPNAVSRVGVTLTDPSVPPDTAITAGPAEGERTVGGAVAFGFAGVPADAAAGFDCRLDAGAWEPCASPRQLPGPAPGTHTFEVRARDGAGLVDATPARRTFSVDPPGPAGPGAPGTAATPGAAPSAPGAPAAPASTAPWPAKLEVTRATVSPSRRRLTITAPITARASGTVRVAFRAAGRTTTFDARIDARRRRVTVDRSIPAAQARAETGIATLAYAGDADTQPQTVRLRAASRAANLRAGRPTYTDGRLRATGRISPRARGVVRVQLLFEPATGATRTLSASASVREGRYRLDRALPAAVRAAIDGRRGVLHAYTLFTGDLGRGLRGELASHQVLGQR